MKSTGLLNDFIAYGNSDSMKALHSPFPGITADTGLSAF